MSGPVGTVTGRRPAAGAATLAILSLLVGVLAAAAAPVGPGFRVAFLRDGDVHVLDAATGAETRLTTDGTAAQVWWTADGRASLFTAAGGTLRWRSGNAPERVRDGVWSPAAICRLVMYAYIMSHRTQIILTDAQYARLKQESERTGVRLAELVRRALDAAYGETGRADVAQVLGASFGAWPDRELDGAVYVEGLRRGMARRLER